MSVHFVINAKTRLGILDIMAIAFIFLPLYGNPVEGLIYSVNLLAFSTTTPINLMFYWVVFIAMIALGIIKLIFTHFDKLLWGGIATKASIVLSVAAICFFAAAREPYVTTLLFLFFVMKILLMIKQSRTNEKSP